MASKRDWLEAGLEVLSEEGAPSLTIERLCAHLNLTKGSFYHHFGGMARYKSDLLEHFETEHTGRYIDGAESAGDSAQAKLYHLLNLVLDDKDTDHDLEIAVRAWALQDAEAQALQRRVDQLRVDYLRSLWRELGGSEDDADPMGRLLYLVLVGAQQVVPPVSADELKEIYTLALRLAPQEKKTSE
ncbi:TetR/AcrR family transcriptional regulator [Nonomuraea roseola]|uniref:TetR/AcrR family transcriptional regulator n=1 Tax=Nonomuraea roseola TaxID=46179 RepID=A0ABV5Q524_9ACTN